MADRKMSLRDRPGRGNNGDDESKETGMRFKTEPGLLVVTVEMGGRTYTEDLNQAALIETDFDGINEALSTHASVFAWWAMLAVRAKAKANNSRRMYERQKAVAYTKHEADLISVGAKATVTAIESAVKTDEKVIAAQRFCDDAEDQSATLDVAVQTLRARKDALLELARNFRMSVEQGLEVKKRGEKSGVMNRSGSAVQARNVERRLRQQQEEDDE